MDQHDHDQKKMDRVALKRNVLFIQVEGHSVTGCYFDQYSFPLCLKREYRPNSQYKITHATAKIKRGQNGPWTMTKKLKKTMNKVAHGRNVQFY